MSAESNRERILELLRISSQDLDDDQISSRLNIKPRQTVNILCRKLAEEGLVVRRQGSSGKITNHISDKATVVVPRGTADLTDSELDSEVPSGSSREQRDAERVILDIIGDQLGLVLSPTSLPHPSGARVEIDGADEGRTVLVECWAHQGTAKPGQKNKLLGDALKLSWIATTLPSKPRLILCLTDPVAAAGFIPPSRSWAAAAFADLGVEVVVVELPRDLRSRLVEAQNRQYR